LVSACTRNQVGWDGDGRRGDLATGTVRLAWAGVVGILLEFAISPIFLTRVAKPPKVSLVLIEAEFTVETEDDDLPCV